MCQVREKLGKPSNKLLNVKKLNLFHKRIQFTTRKSIIIVKGVEKYVKSLLLCSFSRSFHKIVNCVFIMSDLNYFHI